MPTVPLRILFATPDLFGRPGGIARVSRLICKALSESANVERLDIVALNDAIDQTPDTYYLPAAKHSYMPMGQNKVQFIKQILRLSSKEHNIYLSSHVNLLWPLWAIHCWYRCSVLVPVVHGIDVWDRLPWYRHLPLINSSMILSVSNLTKERMIQKNDVASAKVHILHNCIDPNFTVTENLNVPANKANAEWIQTPCLLTVSRLTKDDRYKGHTQVIQALAHVRQQLPTLTYYVVGEGDLVPDLQQLCKQLGITSAVQFLGYVDEATLRTLYARADLFVMPSKGEGFGLVYLEAMAYGLPVIAGNQDAAGEVIQDQATGLLVNPDDTTALADSILRLLTNPELRRQMGEMGKKVATSKFSYTGFKESLLHCLQEALVS